MHRGRRRSDEIRRIEFLERDDTFQKAHDYKRRIFRNSVRVPMITRTFTFSKRKKRTHARHDVGFCLTGVVRRTTTRLRRTIKKIYVKIIRGHRHHRRRGGGNREKFRDFTRIYGYACRRDGDEIMIITSSAFVDEQLFVSRRVSRKRARAKRCREPRRTDVLSN